MDLTVYDDQQSLPIRGEGRLVTGNITYYFWYRARQNEWYMGIHTKKPVRNVKCDVMEYDDVPVFHCSDIKETFITRDQVTKYVDECVTAFRGAPKKYVETHN